MTTDLALAGLNYQDRARALADSWAGHNLYCPNCSSHQLKGASGRSGEFFCPECHSRFQFKGQPAAIGKSVAAGAHDAVTRAIRNGTVAGFFFMHYDPAAGSVRDLLLVPVSGVPPGAIARRATQCHFLLDRIPAEARMAIVTTIRSSSPGGTECIMISRAEEVREKFRRLKPRRSARARHRVKRSGCTEDFAGGEPQRFAQRALQRFRRGRTA